MAKSKRRKAKKKPAKAARKVRKVAKKVARKAAKPAGGGLEALARKIVKATNLTDFPLREFYAEDCTSTEASGQTVTGIAGLEEKLRGWESMQTGTKWSARNVWTGKNRICIEWDAVVNLRDGRVVNLSEVAIHDIKGGKIVAERFYYNPMALAPPGAGGPS